MKQPPRAGAAPLRSGPAIPVAGRTTGPAGSRKTGSEAMTMSESAIHAARALLKGTIAENALGPDVMYAVRGFRAGLMDRHGFLETVEAGYRSAGAAFKFDSHGNLRKV